MAKLVYSFITSLDGYIEDPDGSFAFAAPDEEVHRAANEQALAASALLFGRGLFEVMEEPWTAAAKRDDLPPVEAEFAKAYVATPRYVFSDTLERAPEGVQLVRRTEARAVVERLKRESEGELPHRRCRLGGIVDRPDRRLHAFRCPDRRRRRQAVSSRWISLAAAPDRRAEVRLRRPAPSVRARRLARVLRLATVCANE